MLKNFTEELKEAREKAGITLQIVAAKTRIDIKFLEELEDGNFNFLPELYVKAFIKQYAKVVGLDEDETVQKYNIAKEGREKPPAGDTKRRQEIQDENGTTGMDDTGLKTSVQKKSFIDESTKQQTSAGETKKQNSLVLGGAALGVIVISVLAYFLFFNKSEQIIVEETPYEEVIKDTPARFIEEAGDTSNENNITAGLEQLSLTIANVDSIDSAWVYVIIDGTTPHEFLLLPNIFTSVIANNNFRFTLGNSGVIKLTLNNEEIAFDGNRGAVRHFKLDRNGIERIYFPPQVNQE